MESLRKNILRLSKTGMFAKHIHMCFYKKDSNQGMRSVDWKFCQCQYFEWTCYSLLPLQVITLVSFDFNSNNLPWACEELSREVERQGWESRCPWLHSIHHHTLALAAEDSNKQAGCRSILIVRSTPGEGLAISMCLQYGTLPRWLFAVSGLPEYCTFFHFSSVRPSVFTFLDNLMVETMKTIYFQNAHHLGWSSWPHWPHWPPGSHGSL